MCVCVISYEWGFPGGSDGVYICMCLWVCMYVFMSVCDICVSIYVCVSEHVCICLCLSVYMYVSVSVCVYV